MEKLILVLLFLFSYVVDYSADSYDQKNIEYYVMKVHHNEQLKAEEEKYQEKFNEVIEFIKQHEGFRNHVYLDINGYATIGYGFLTKYVPFKKYITRKQADSIVIDKMLQNVKIVNKKYPHLNKYQNLSVAHLIYCKGLGRIQKHPLHIQLKNNNINKNTWIYFSVYEKERKHYRKTRNFEYALYNYK